MKRVFLALLLCAGAAAFAADTGGVNTGKQKWDGPKILTQTAPRIATLTGHETLGLDAKQVQHLDPDGSHRNITMNITLDENRGYWIRFKNTGNNSDNLVIKDAAGSTIGTVQNSEVGDFRIPSTGSVWTAEVYGAAFAGGLQADGSVAGATGQAQDFGTNGVKADVVAESTGATGVTVDGVLLKDTTVDVNGTADAIILDADGDTTISSPTGNQIDIEINNADDFTFTANTFTALSGSSIATNTIAETTAASGVTIDSLLVKDAGVVVGTSGTLDLNGEADALVLDADGNTSICASTDDQIDVEIAGADDFRFTANVLNCLSGSSIEVNTINEETAGSGVTIDSVLLKDGDIVLGDSALDNTVTIQSATDEGANYVITIPDMTASTTLPLLNVAGTWTANQTFPNTGLLLNDTGGDHTTNIKQNSNEAASRTLNIPALGGDDTLVTLATAQTFTGAKTFASASGSVIRASQRIRYSIAGAKVGSAAGFVVNAASDIYAATCPASQTAAKLVIPIGALKVGSTITAFGLLGQIESGGNAVTVDADLRKSTTAAGDFSDASVSTMTQIAVNADTAIDSTQDKTGLSTTTLQTEEYYIVVTVTTNASTDVDIRGVTLVITEN